MTEPTRDIDLSTPFPVIANVSRVVTSVVDRITGDRVEVPLMVAAACKAALEQHGIESRVMYGQTAWIEILQDNTVLWAGCWGENHGYWVATQFGEVVDLNTSVAFRKPAHQSPSSAAALSPPMLWSAQVPVFYRYRPEGVAELELEDERDLRQYQAVLREIREKCLPGALAGEAEPFPNEPILCPGRRVLDDSEQRFRKFDRVISIRGIPKAPF